MLIKREQHKGIFRVSRSWLWLFGNCLISSFHRERLRFQGLRVANEMSSCILCLHMLSKIDRVKLDREAAEQDEFSFANSVIDPGQTNWLLIKSSRHRQHWHKFPKARSNCSRYS